MKFIVFALIERILINKSFFKESYLKSYVINVNIDFKEYSLSAKKI